MNATQPPFEFTTDTILSLLEEIAKRDHGGHFTLFRFSTGYKCIFGTPNLDRDVDPITEEIDPTCDYGLVWDLPTDATPAAAAASCIDRSFVESSVESLIEAKLGKAIMAEPWGKGLKAQHPVGPYRVDLALLEHGIGIECDGHDFHKTRQQRTHDAAKDRFLTAQGLRVLRCTGTEITNNLAKVVSDIKAVIESNPAGK